MTHVHPPLMPSYHQYWFYFIFFVIYVRNAFAIFERVVLLETRRVSVYTSVYLFTPEHYIRARTNNPVNLHRPHSATNPWIMFRLPTPSSLAAIFFIAARRRSIAFVHRPSTYTRAFTYQIHWNITSRIPPSNLNIFFFFRYTSGKCLRVCSIK